MSITTLSHVVYLVRVHPNFVMSHNNVWYEQQSESRVPYDESILIVIPRLTTTYDQFRNVKSQTMSGQFPQSIELLLLPMVISFFLGLYLYVLLLIIKSREEHSFQEIQPTQQIWHCLRVAEIFPEESILSAVRRELSWTHIKTLIYIDDPVKRDFYIEIARIESWSSRQLQEHINSMLFERIAISKKPEETIRKDLESLRTKKTLSSDLAFRDPYILDFLGLSDTFSEKDLESAIIVELQRFIVELGSDFAFLARQKRITIDNRDYYIDLLFYHRRFKCMVVIDLKIGEFEAGFKDQMELYLRYLEKYEMVEGENTPVGLILCTGKNHEHVKLLQLEKSNIRIAECLTLLPPKKLLEDKLHRSIEIARVRLALRESEVGNE